jgi:hypothetical protein
MAHAFVNRKSAASDRHSYIGRPHAGDARLDLGYGTLEPKFHTDYQQSSKYPYLDDDVELPEEEVLDSDDVDEFIAKAGLGKTRVDFGAKYGTDPFYFVAGNTKLSDCFSRPDEVLKEVEAMARTIKQKPYLRTSARLSRKSGVPDDQSNATFKASSAGNYRPTGSKKGYSGQTPDIVSDTLDDESTDDNAFRLVDILDDDDRALKKVRDTMANVGRLNKKIREV